MSAMWAMRRSAESRVRESSEGGRIGPDLDLAPLFYSPLRGKQRRLPLAAVPRHVASVLPAPPASSCVCRQGKAQARSRSQRGGRGARPTHQSATFHGAFFALPPRFSAWPPCRFALSRGKSESRKRLITNDEEDGAGPGRRNRARHTHSMMICERPTSSAVWQARPAPYLEA